MIVRFYNLVPINLGYRKYLKTFLAGMLKREQVNWVSLDFIFCDDDYLLQINQTFLSHNTYTDIISFNLAEEGEPIQGEFYISIPRVKENAHIHQQSFGKELLRVIFHGVLHFCGYDDKNPSSKLIMRKKEDFYLDQYVPRGTL